jgi:DNA invertase Pin-like site-specific DNA recombinase
VTFPLAGTDMFHFVEMLWGEIGGLGRSPFISEDRGYYHLRADQSEYNRWESNRPIYRRGMRLDYCVPIHAIYYDSDSERREDRTRNKAILIDVKTKSPDSLVVSAQCNLLAVVDGFSRLLREIAKFGDEDTIAHLIEPGFQNKLQPIISDEERIKWESILTLARTLPSTKDIAEKKRKGAPPLEERPDVEEKREKARRYLKMITKGTPKHIAAQLVGHSRKTLERWVERLLPPEEIKAIKGN